MEPLSAGNLKEQAWAAAKLELQTDLWALLKVLYPPPEHYWNATFHRAICDRHFVRKNPAYSIAEQDHRKQRLLLFPRNHFKTTIDICDIVQWILCFPDIRVLIASGTRDNAMKMLQAVKAHFQYNEVLRTFFPELCPNAKKAEDFGTKEAFTCPARKKRFLREPTVSIASPDSTVAGMHYDVVKFDDLVNETNSRTAEGIKQVIQWYKLTNPLLEPYGYRDVIGTPYDYSDLSGEILGTTWYKDRSIAELHNGYLVTLSPCYEEDGVTPIFPERYTKEKLDQERSEMGTFYFSAQMLCRPVPGDAVHFPRELLEKAEVAKKDLPANRVYFTTFDLAISQASDADQTAIVTCSVGTPEGYRSPHIYVEHILVGHLKPLEVCEKLYQVYRQFRPFQIRTEQVGFARLLEPIVRAEAQRQKAFLPLVWIPRDTNVAKQARIAGLQPWLERGELHIVRECPNKEELILQLTRFPKYRRDDIADALADQLSVVSYFSAEDSVPLPDLTARSGDPRLGLVA